jgi:hypothetical protein
MCFVSGMSGSGHRPLLPADLAAAEARAAEAEARASAAEATIAQLRLLIEKLRRELYGRRSERKAALIEQLALELGPDKRRCLAGLTGGVAQQAVDAGRNEALLPAPHRRSADVGALGDLGDRQPLGRAKDDPSPRGMFLGAVAIGDDRLETSSILSRDQWTNLLSHRSSVLRKRSLVNPLNASVH